MTGKFCVAFNHLSEDYNNSLISAFKTWSIAAPKQSKIDNFYICGNTPASLDENAKIIGGYGLNYRQTLVELVNEAACEFLILMLKPVRLELLDTFGQWLNTIVENDIHFSYSAHQQQIDINSLEDQPLIDYQFGSVRDDFDFGAMLILKREAAKETLTRYTSLICDDQTALYALRLSMSLKFLPVRFETKTYKTKELKKEDQHQSHFAYASAAGASNQKSFERTFVEFSKLAGFYSDREPKTIDPKSSTFNVEASIIIPVRNRAGKIEHAVQSALSQKTNFKFNVIVVDNHSTDGTTEILQALAQSNSALIHLIPDRTDLGIGGCWELAVNYIECGRFCLQLDSDDLYIDDQVIKRIVEKFYITKAAAIVGSYLLVDRDLQPIPPGSIEHREWNDITGYTNILRINGLGAPRAFYTPVIRSIGFPNVSYGEDYFVMLAIAREYKIARIYEHLYLCRRWEGNSDASPSISKLNQFHRYKDELRSKEIETRKVCFSCE